MTTLVERLSDHVTLKELISTYFGEVAANGALSSFAAEAVTVTMHTLLTEAAIEIERLERELDAATKDSNYQCRERAKEFEKCMNLEEALSHARKDVERVDFMERYLCRAGEVKNEHGQTVKLARVWSIMGELETLRDTLDAMQAALTAKPPKGTPS